MATTCELIAKSVLGSDTATVTLGSGGTIPQTYTDLLVVVSVRTARNALADSLKMEFNGNTSNYSWRRLEGDGSAANSNTGSDTTVALVNADTSTASTFSAVEVYIPNYAGSTNKSYSCTSALENNATTGQIEARANLWSNTAAITSVAFSSGNSANFRSGSSFYLYGITKA